MSTEIDYKTLALRAVWRQARKHPDLTIADVRPLMNAMDVPPGVQANVMRSAVAKGWIAETNDWVRVKKNRTSSTTDVRVYQSLIYMDHPRGGMMPYSVS